jgi:hypothetical protein
VNRHVAVETIIRLLPALMEFFKKEGDGGNAEADRTYRTLCDCRVLVALHALSDILQPVQRLQKIFQERGLSVYRLLRAKEECVSALKRMRQGPDGVVLPRASLFVNSCTEERRRGRAIKLAFKKHELHDFPGRDGFKAPLEDTGVIAFLDTMCSSLETRFKEDCDAVIEKFQVLDPAAFDGSSFLSGQAELQDIANHFSALMLPESCFTRIDPNQLMADWSRFKLTQEYREATQQGAKPDYCATQESFWGRFFLEGSGSPEQVQTMRPEDRYCELFKVVAMAIVIITNNAEAERTFSCMNRVCTEASQELHHCLSLTCSPSCW